MGVDLDGTLARYERWVGIDHIGEPIWPMVERVKQWIAEGKQVKIMTARISPQALDLNDVSRRFCEQIIQEWTEEHIGVRLPVTCVKDLDMIELWDDRAVQVAANEGEPTTRWASRV